MVKKQPAGNRAVKRNVVPLYLLAVLLDHALNRGLTQRQIGDHLAEDHEIALDRHTLLRNLRELETQCNAGLFPDLYIEHTSAGSGRTRWRIVRESEFDPSEIRFLSDAVLAFLAAPQHHRDDLLNKLARLSKSHGVLPRVTQSMDETLVSKQLFSTVDQLDEAIQENRVVSFDLNAYGPDGKLYSGEERHLVRPYQLLMQGGRYYLLGRYLHPRSGYEEQNFHFRVDLITNVEVKEPVDEHDKALWAKGLVGNAFNVAKYRAQQPLLWSDPPEEIRFRIDANRCTWAFDRFGKAVKFGKERDGFVEATVYSSPTAMLQWALAHPNEIEVIEPASLRQRLKEKAEELLKLYT